MKNKLITFIIIVCASYQINAQSITLESINAQIGLGISSPYDSRDEIADTGFFLQGELVYKVASWLELKPYAGLILTSSNGKDLNDNPTDEKATSKAFLAGGKARIRVPIRWVAPYIELGIGASIGKFETLTVFDNISKNGLAYHIPFALGLELGKNNGVDLGFTYYFHPSLKQYSGALALGITIPIKSKKVQ
jgi:hypothetical protein